MTECPHDYLRSEQVVMLGRSYGEWLMSPCVRCGAARIEPPVPAPPPAVGDFVIARNGACFVCRTSGSWANPWQTSPPPVADVRPRLDRP